MTTGTTTSETSAGDATPARGVSRKNVFGVLAVALGLVLALLDQVIVSTALPTIVGDIGGVDQLSGAVTAYLVASAATTPIWGKLGDLYGRRRSFISAIVIFLIGSVLSGLSQTMIELIGFRALQGLGAGGLMVGAFALISDLVNTPAERAKLLAVIGAIMPTALALGPLVGGLLTQHASWRWVFYVNIPIGALAIVASALGIPRAPARRKVRIDYAGSALLSGAIVALTLLCSWAGEKKPWTSLPMLGLAALTVVLVVVFVFVERRAIEAVVPPRLFGSRDFTLAQVLGFILGAAQLSLLVYLPQYLQTVQLVSPTNSGLLVLPFTVGFIGSQLISARFMARLGRTRPFVITGTVLATIGIVLMQTLDANTNIVIACTLPILAGVGIGLVLQSTQLIIFGNTDKRDMGAASGLLNLGRTLGGTIGIAILGGLYSGRLTDALASRLGDSAAGSLTSSGGQLTPAQLGTLPSDALDAVQNGASQGLHVVLIGGAIVAAVCFFISLFLDGRIETGARRDTADRPAATPAPANSTGPARDESDGGSATTGSRATAGATTP